MLMDCSRGGDFGDRRSGRAQDPASTRLKRNPSRFYDMGQPRRCLVEIEHAAWSVEDPVAAAEWYVEHLGMEIVRSAGPPAHARFLADSTEDLTSTLSGALTAI